MNNLVSPAQKQFAVTGKFDEILIPKKITHVVLRKNPPKIKRGNMRGGPSEVAAVTVGASVDIT